jgi:hypothetical protein
MEFKKRLGKPGSTDKRFYVAGLRMVPRAAPEVGLKLLQ